jgi:flagellar biosynthesis anti-sigma factor FlgM
MSLVFLEANMRNSSSPSEKYSYSEHADTVVSFQAGSEGNDAKREYKEESKSPQPDGPSVSENSDESEGVRPDKVAQIRKALEEGSYSVDPTKVADAIIEKMLQSPGALDRSFPDTDRKTDPEE